MLTFLVDKMSVAKVLAVLELHYRPYLDSALLW